MNFVDRSQRANHYASTSWRKRDTVHHVSGHCSRSKVTGQGHDHTECYDGGGMHFNGLASRLTLFQCFVTYLNSKKLKTKNIPCIICCHLLKCLIVKWFYRPHTHTNYHWAKVPVMDEISSHTAYQRCFRLF